MLPCGFPEYLSASFVKDWAQFDLFGLIAVNIIHLSDTLSNKLACIQ